MHKLLRRQVEKATTDGALDVEALLDAVGSAYDEVDNERRLNARALTVMQEELEAAQRRTREHAEARFNAVMDNVGEAVVVIDPRGIIESFNGAAEHIFGFAASDVVGCNVSMLMTESDAFHHDETLRRYTETGKGNIIGIGREVLAKRQGGEEFPVELAVGEILTGPERRFVGIIRDISQRKQIEKTLKESEVRFRDLVGSASDWFWETDTENRLSFVSERIAAILGVKPSAVLGYTYFDFGDFPSEVEGRLREDLSARRPFRDVVFDVGPQGEKDGKTIRISGLPIKDAHGEFSGYRGIGADITREAKAEKLAIQTRQQLVDALESIVDGIAVFDADDRLLMSNRQYSSMLLAAGEHIVPGIGFKDIVRLAVDSDIFDTEGRSREQWIQERLEHHRRASGEPMIHSMIDSSRVLIREYRTSDGGTITVRTDVTEMKRREEQLDALQKRYQLILDSAGEGIVGLTPRGRISFVNQMATTLLCYRADDLIGRCFHLMVQPYDSEGEIRSSDDSPIRLAYSAGTAAHVHDDLFRRQDGEMFHVEYLVAPIMEGDLVAGAVLLFRDVTLRHQYEAVLANQHRELERLVGERTAELSREIEVRAHTEDALRTSRERLKGVTDSLFEGVLVVNRSGEIVFANPSAQRLIQAESIAGDIEGHPLDDLFRLRTAGADLGFSQSPWSRVATDGVTVRDDDAQFVTASGRVVPVAFACSPLGDEGNRSAAIISFRDIGALKEAQREALQSSRLASVGQLAAGIAHEINTPIQYIGDNLRFLGEAANELAPILEAAGKLALAAAGFPEAEAFDKAAAAADTDYLMDEIPTAIRQSLDGVAQVARIVLSMKEFSHPGSTSKSMNDLNRALESTLTVSRNSWKHSAQVECHFAPDLPPVLCHIGELNQVFLNLIINAAHAIESSGKTLPGTITITTRAEAGQAIVEVADSGTGVPEALRDRIFDPFFTTKVVGKGTGQGLAICRDVVVTKHGGHLDVGGNEGEGAVFTVKLPIEGSDTLKGGAI